MILRFGIIGAGIISGKHLSALDNNPDTTISAIADLDLEKARCTAKAYGAAAYNDYRDMIQQESPDAVIINLPHYLHEECTLFCAGRGIHVLVEKPMSVSAASCRSMIRFCDQCGTVLQIGHIQRYFPENKKAKEIIDSGMLGRLLMIQDIRTSLYFTASRPGWFLKKELSGGGILMNLGAHSIDKIKFLTGSTFAEVSGNCTFDHPQDSIEGSAQVFLKTVSGVTASITLCGYHDVPVNETTLFFSDGILKLHTGKNLEIWRDGAFRELISTDPLLPFQEQLGDFVRAILERTLPAADGVYSEDIIAVIENIYQETGDYHENQRKTLSQPSNI